VASVGSSVPWSLALHRHAYIDTGAHLENAEPSWQVACPRWEELFRETFGPVTPLHIEAQALAGGWKQLYASKTSKKQLCPSEWEVKAFLKGLVACGAKDGIAVCALLDGSGSMGKGNLFAGLPAYLDSTRLHLAGLITLRLLQTAKRQWSCF